MLFLFFGVRGFPASVVVYLCGEFLSCRVLRRILVILFLLDFHVVEDSIDIVDALEVLDESNIAICILI